MITRKIKRDNSPPCLARRLVSYSTVSCSATTTNGNWSQVEVDLNSLNRLEKEILKHSRKCQLSCQSHQMELLRVYKHMDFTTTSIRGQATTKTIPYNESVCTGYIQVHHKVSFRNDFKRQVDISTGKTE